MPITKSEKNRRRRVYNNKVKRAQLHAKRTDYINMSQVKSFMIAKRCSLTIAMIAMLEQKYENRAGSYE